MIIIVNIFISLILFYFQAVASGHLTIFGFFPYIMLILILFFSLERKIYESLMFAFIAGLILDVISGGPFGLNLIILILAAFAGSFLKQRGNTGSLSLIIICTAVFSLMYYGFYGIYIGLASKFFSWHATFFCLGQILITLAFALFLFPIFARLFLWEKKYEERHR